MKAKLTSHQQKVLAILEKCHQGISAQAIYQKLRNEHKIGLATVYRALDALKLQGRISGLTMPSGETVYSLSPIDQHHLNCLQCGTTFALEACPLATLQTNITERIGFQVFYHTLEFFGLCLQCQSLSGQVQAPS